MSLPEPLPWLPGRLLTDPGWLAARIEDAAGSYRTPDRGVRATLWWYSASVVLVGPAVHALVTTGRALSLHAEDIRFTLTPYGWPERVAPMPDAGDVAAGAAAFGHHLDDTLARIVQPLAKAGDVPVQRLWALAADSLGNRLLAERQSDLAAEIAAVSAQLRPAPRYVEISAGEGRTPATYLRRGSCCLIFRIPGQGLCVSCPRQDPSIRQLRLETHAQAYG